MSNGKQNTISDLLLEKEDTNEVLIDWSNTSDIRRAIVVSEILNKKY